MLDLLPILVSLASLLIILVNIYNKAFENNKPTCKDYILNTYLYIVLGIILITIMCLVNDKGQILISPLSLGLSTFISFILLIVIWIALMAGIYFLPPKYYGLIHILWVAAMYFLASIFYPMYKIGQELNVLIPSVLVTIAVVLTVSLIGYYKGDIFNFDLKKYLRYALIALIIGEILAYNFINDMNTLMNVTIVFAILGIIIFGLFLLAHTKDLKKRSEECVNANYPKESVKFIVSIINIISDVIRILAISKMKRRR